MLIQLLCVGKLKEKYWIQGMAEYTKRLAPYIKYQVIELPDEPAPEKLNKTELTRLIEKEGERLLAYIKPTGHVVALAIDGQLWSSEKLAARLEHLAIYGAERVTFVIGGSNGLSNSVLHRAQTKLSFGRMTFPHPLMRLILTEQIYRAVKMNRGEPYHK